MEAKQYPSIKTRFVDKKNPDRTLTITHVEPGDKKGREIRGKIEYPGDPFQHGRNYATDQRTFWNVWGAPS